MARLPTPGSDNGEWGEILNTYLLQSHTADGSLKPNSVTNATISDVSGSKITDASVSLAKLQGVGLANGLATLDADATLSESQVPERLTESELTTVFATKEELAHRVVGRLTGDAAPAIQAAIDAVAALGGGTVILYAGHDYTVNSTIHLRSNITLEFNAATLTAAPNAAFDNINLGTDAITGTAYTPAAIKPILSVIGSPSDRLQNVIIRGGTIDGNGLNQPDDGSYANVAVHEADYTFIDVTSLNAKPDITINLPGGANTGRRAFCLFIGHALKTTVQGTYRNSGYDSIGIREGATETLLYNVAAYQAKKGALQIATGALRTKIIGGFYDNTEGGTDSSHAIFCHSAVWLDVIGATMRANTGSCFVAFGDSIWGKSKEVTVSGVAMDHTGTPATPMVSMPSGFVEKIIVQDLTFRKAGGGPLLSVVSGADRIYTRRWTGDSTSAGVGMSLTNVTDFEITGMDIKTTIAGNQVISLSGSSRGRISGTFIQTTGVSIIMTACSKITVQQSRLVATDSVQAIGGNSNIDVFDNDLTGITNANKLRVYGPDSGRVRGNLGATTEANGTATIPAASTSVTISHGLWVGTSTAATPRTDRLWRAADFQVSFAGNPGAAKAVWVSSVTTTQVTFTVDAAPGADLSVVWAARMDRNT